MKLLTGQDEQNVETLRAFARWVLALAQEGDVSAFDVQDKATVMGLLVPVRATEPCDEEACLCAEVDNIPGDCYRLAPWVGDA